MPGLFKILLIDDNPDDRLLIIRELKKLFIIDVEEIIDSKGLEHALELNDFDIVITDYQLRWTTGVEILIKIKSINPLMPVIMFTGTGSEEIAVMAMKIGLTDYILKSPHHYVRLAMSVKSAIFRMREDLLRKHAENALRNSEENYRSLVENIGIGFTRFDENFNIIMVNEAQARLFKREPSEFAGLKLSDLFSQHPMEIIHLQDHLSQSFYVPQENLARGIRADNSFFDALIRTFPTFNAQGEVSGFIEITEDVSGRLRSERLQEVVFNIANAVLLTDTLQQLLSVISNELARVTNSSGMRVVLLSQEAEIGYQAVYSSNDDQNMSEPLEGKTLAGLVISQGNALLLKQSEIKELLKSGEIDNVIHGIKVWMGVPLKNRSNILGALVLHSFEAENAFTVADLDILQFVSNQIAIAVENKRNADSVRDSEMRFRSLVEQSADGIIIFDNNGTVIEWNHAMESISLVPASEAIGKKLWELQYELGDIDCKDESYLLRMKAGFYNMINTFSNKESIIDEGRLKLRNGETRVVQLSMFPIKFQGATNNGAFVKDVTDQKRVAEEIVKAGKKAEESDKLKTTFLSNISHELRTPLNAIVGFAALLADPDQSESDRKMCRENIFANSNNLLNQFNNIIEMSKIESGQEELVFSDFEVNDLMDELAQETIGGFAKKNVGFSVVKSLPDKRVMINSDKTYLRQLLIQLLINAFKSTNEGIVEIGYYLKGDENIVFSIRDTGTGIPEDKIPILFDSFSSSNDDDINLNYSGMRVRMNIVKKIVTLLDGMVHYEPAKPHGSVFNIVLPLVKYRKDKEMEVFSADNLASITGKWVGKSILIVEDVDSNYQFLVATIRRSGATITWARQGEEAIEMIANGQHFDLVLMDVQLAGLDGYEVTRKIKELRPELPIVAQTAYAMTGEKEKSQDAGCDDYLPKPIRPAILLQTMAKYL